MGKFDEYMGIAAVNEEQYIIPASEAMAKIMAGAKQVQIELFKDESDNDSVKLAVRTDGRIRVVKGEIAANSIAAIEKLSGRANIMRDFLQGDTEKDMLNPTRDHASHNGFDITITTQADGKYRMTFTAPDAEVQAPDHGDGDVRRPKRYISRNDLSGDESVVEGREFFHEGDDLMRGITFEDLITALNSNEQTVDEAAVRRVFSDMYRANLEDAKAELRDSMKKIISMATAGRG